MKTIERSIFVAAVILAACEQQAEQAQEQETPAVQQQAPLTPDTPAFSILIRDRDHLTPGDTVRSERNCTPGSHVEVEVEIGGGRANNSAQGSAFCDQTKVAGEVTALDPGGGAQVTNEAQGQQVAGRAGCVWGAINAAPPNNSTWRVECLFW